MASSDRTLPLSDPPRDDRPGDAWVCGRSCDGTPCPAGPTPRGGCQGHLGGCRPKETRGGWQCNRPAIFGGKCEPGAHADGSCGLACPPCRPRRSGWVRRRQSVAAAGLAAFLFLAVGLAGPWRAEFAAPGGLAQSHAQILGGPDRTNRCAACHPAAGQGVGQWLATAVGAAHPPLTQTDLCLECHHARIPRSRARSPHNLTAAQLTAVRASRTPGSRSWHDLVPGIAGGGEGIACSACHREHHGSDADLAQLTDRQCQACHQDAFASFADGHPEFSGWPHGRQPGEPGPRIAFDHRSHRHRHFPQQDASFDCRGCHSIDADDAVARLASYRTACSACHDAGLNQQTGDGFALLGLPSVDAAQLRSRGADPPRWPAAATGMFDGRLPPLARLLIAGDARSRAALHELPRNGDWGRLADARPETARAAAHLMAAIAEAADEIGRRGQPALSERLIAAGVPEPIARELAHGVPADLVADTMRQWMSEPADESPQAAEAPSPSNADAPRGTDGDSLLADDEALLMEDEPLLANGDPLTADGDPLSTERDPRRAASLGGPAESEIEETRAGIEPGDRVPSGGWYRDGRRMDVRYRPSGHSDRRLKAMVELALSGADGDPPAIEALRASPSVEACLECHRPIEDAAGRWNWRSAAGDPQGRTFTRFSHGPHLTLPRLQDCTHCHAVADESGAASVASDSLDGGGEHAEFLPLRRSRCAACHRTGAAGNRCVQCHRYHVDEFERGAGR